MSELEEARAHLARLEKEDELVKAVEAADKAHEDGGGDTTADTWAAHNRAQEALAAHRQEVYPGGMGTQVGGDAKTDEPASTEWPANPPQTEGQ